MQTSVRSWKDQQVELHPHIKTSVEKKKVCLSRTTGCLTGNCTVEGVLPGYRKMCDNRPFCFAYAHVETDQCQDVSKYLEIIYSCEQKGEMVFNGLL